MTKTEHLPAAIDEVDGAWLTAMLQRTGRIPADGEVTVTGAAPLGGTAYTTTMTRLTLDGPAGTPATAIVKLPVGGPVRALIDAIGAYTREVTFYAELAGELPVRVPESYVAVQAPDSTDFVLVIEDLSHLERPDQLAGLSLDQVGSAVDALARFHAWGWESERLDGYADRFPPLDGPMAGAVYGQFARFFAQAWPTVGQAPVVTDEARVVGDRFTELLPFFVAELSTPRTLVHGELRAENMFLLPDDILMLDFQTVAQHAGIVDVAYLVTQSLTVDVRAGQEEWLVRRYVDALAAAGVEDYTYEQAWRQYRIALAFNLLLTGLAFAQYEEADDRGKRLLVEMLSRACDAITRNDTPAVLPGGDRSRFEAEVRAAHAEEERTAAPVTTLDQLPFTYEHLTTQWLTELVCAGREGVEVSAFRAEDADDLGRGHARIWLEYRGDATGLPQSVFCKDSHRLELRIFNAFMVAGEVQFYDTIQPALGVETPDALHVGYDPTTHNSLLVFKDLREHGLTFCTDKTHVTRELAEGQMRYLAAVHARFWDGMTSNPAMTALRPFREVYDRVDTIFGGNFGGVVLNGFHAAAAAIPDAVLARAEEVRPAVERALAAQWSAEPTLTHNDSHIDNWFPSPENGQLRLGDWQIVARGDLAFDLALVVSTSPTVEDRRAWERDLIALYVEELAAAGGPRLGVDEVFDRYRTQLFMALAWWTPTVKSDVDFEFHDLDGTFEIIRRITTAIDDLEAFAS